VRRRYGAHPAGPAGDQAFILCNLAVRREVMVPFPDDLLCAEENAVLSELGRRGVPMFYAPDLVVYHERRATHRGFAGQMHKYGRGRGQLLRREPSTFRPWYGAPSAVLAYLVLLPLLLLLLGPVALVPLVAYGAAVTVAAAWIARTVRRPGDAVLAGALLVTLHASYGAGVVRGLTMRRRELAAPVGRWAEDVPGPVGAVDAP
jgi:hypothetical protein